MLSDFEYLASMRVELYIAHTAAVEPSYSLNRIKATTLLVVDAYTKM